MRGNKRKLKGSEKRDMLLRRQREPELGLIAFVTKLTHRSGATQATRFGSKRTFGTPSVCA